MRFFTQNLVTHKERGGKRGGVWKEKAEQIKLTGPRESLLHEQLAVLVGFLSDGQKKKKKRPTFSQNSHKHFSVRCIVLWIPLCSADRSRPHLWCDATCCFPDCTNDTGHHGQRADRAGFKNYWHAPPSDQWHTAGGTFQPVTSQRRYCGLLHFPANTANGSWLSKSPFRSACNIVD